jgi:hypothetical protein
MNYTAFLKEIESEIDRLLTTNDELTSIELIIVINHFNELTSLDLSIVDFLIDNSLQYIYKSYFHSEQ